MEAKLRDLLVGAGIGDIIGGTRNSGFIQRMLGEVKKVHKGAYRPITALAKDSTMSAPRVFSYGKVKTPSGWLQTRFGKAKASAEAPAKAPEPAVKKPDMALLGQYHNARKTGKNKPAIAQFEKLYHDWLLVNDKEYREKYNMSDVAKENKARRDREYTEERYIRPYRKTIANIKYYSQPENWKNLTTKKGLQCISKYTIWITFRSKCQRSEQTPTLMLIRYRMLRCVVLTRCGSKRTTSRVKN